MLELTLPFPPSVNHYWRKWRGRMVLGGKARAYRQNVATLLRAKGIQPMTGHLAVAIEVYPPDRRRRDLDNLLKAIGDCLQHGDVFVDDSQIVWLLIEKAQVIPGGKIVVRVTDRGATYSSRCE